MAGIITVHDLFGSASVEVGVLGQYGQVAGSNPVAVRIFQSTLFISIIT